MQPKSNISKMFQLSASTARHTQEHYKSGCFVGVSLGAGAMADQSLALLSPTSLPLFCSYLLFPSPTVPSFVVHLPVRSFESFIISLSLSFVVAGFHAKTLRLSLPTALHPPSPRAPQPAISDRRPLFLPRPISSTVKAESEAVGRVIKFQRICQGAETAVVSPSLHCAEEAEPLLCPFVVA